MSYLINKRKHPKFKKVYIYDIDYDILVSKIDEILNRYFSSTYLNLPIPPRKYYKHLSEKQLKMIAGESILHDLIHAEGGVFIGKGFDIKSSNPIPNSIDAFGKDNYGNLIFGEAKYIAHPTSANHGVIEDYVKFVERKRTGQDIRLLNYALDENGYSFEYDKTHSRTLYMLAISDREKDLKTMSKEEAIEGWIISKLDKEPFDETHVFKYLSISYEQFEELVIYIKGEF